MKTSIQNAEERGMPSQIYFEPPMSVLRFFFNPYGCPESGALTSVQMGVRCKDKPGLRLWILSDIEQTAQMIYQVNVIHAFSLVA